MLQNTSKSFCHKYSLIAIMAEYISRLSAIVMQLVRQFALLHLFFAALVLLSPPQGLFLFIFVSLVNFFSLHRMAHFGDCLLIFPPLLHGMEICERSTNILFPCLLCFESVKHEIEFSSCAAVKKSGICDFPDSLRSSLARQLICLCSQKQVIAFFHLSKAENLGVGLRGPKRELAPGALSFLPCRKNAHLKLPHTCPAF